MGGLSTLLKGKDTTYKADPLAKDVNAAGKSGLDLMSEGARGLGGIYRQDPSQFVNNQIASENHLLRGAADDAIKRTRNLIAQRGMSGSSIGLGQEVNNARDFDTKIAMNNASALGRVRDMGIENNQGLMNAGNSLWNTKLQGQQNLQMQDIKKRSGGLAGLVGAGIGAYYGGAQGAQAGMAMGNAYAAS